MWFSAKDDSDNVYYFNKITGETKWELSESDEVAENNSDNFYEGMDGISGINYNDSFNSADIEPPDSKKQTYEFSDMSAARPPEPLRFGPGSPYGSPDHQRSPSHGYSMQRDVSNASRTFGRGGQTCVNEILETESDRVLRKLEALKMTGHVVERKGEWAMWESQQGAVFFVHQDQTYGGQWKAPPAFAEADNNAVYADVDREMSFAADRIAHTPSSKRLHFDKSSMYSRGEKAGLHSGRPASSSAQHSSSPVPLHPHYGRKSDGYDPSKPYAEDTVGQDSYHNYSGEDEDAGGAEDDWSAYGDTTTDNYNTQNNGHQNGHQGKFSTNNTPTRRRGKEDIHQVIPANTTIDNLSSYPEILNYPNENKNPDFYFQYGKLNGTFKDLSPVKDARLLTDEPTTTLSEAAQQYKQVYKHLVVNDKKAEVDIDTSNLQKNADTAKLRWKNFLDEQEDADDDNKEQERRKHILDEDDDDLDVTNKGTFLQKSMKTSSKFSSDIDFNKLYARSIVIRQKWPWTCLADMETNKLFYRNECQDAFQFDPPAEFVEDVEADSRAMKKDHKKGFVHAQRKDDFVLGNDRYRDDEKEVTPAMAAVMLQKFKEEITQRRTKFLHDQEKRESLNNTKRDRFRVVGGIIPSTERKAVKMNVEGSNYTSPVLNDSSFVEFGKQTTSDFKKIEKTLMARKFSDFVTEHAPIEEDDDATYSGTHGHKKGNEKNKVPHRRHDPAFIGDVHWEDAKCLLHRLRRMASNPKGSSTQQFNLSGTHNSFCSHETKANPLTSSLNMSQYVSTADTDHGTADHVPVDKVQSHEYLVARDTIRNLRFQHNDFEDIGMYAPSPIANQLPALHDPMEESGVAHESAEGDKKLQPRFLYRRQESHCIVPDEQMSQRKKRLMQLSEREKQLTEFQIAVNTTRKQTGQIRTCLTEVHQLLDLCEGSSGFIESEIRHRHLLEVSVLHRSMMLRPPNPRDYQTSFPGNQEYISIPHSLNKSQFIDVVKKSPATVKVEIEKEGSWDKYIIKTFTRNFDSAQNAKTTNKVKFSAIAGEGTSLVSTVPGKYKTTIVYVHMKTNSIQHVEPFDLKFRRLQHTLFKENRSDYDFARPSECVTNSHFQHLQLLSDAHGGFLFWAEEKGLYYHSDRVSISLEEEPSFGADGFRRLTAAAARADSMRSKTVNRDGSGSDDSDGSGEESELEEDKDTAGSPNAKGNMVSRMRGLADSFSLSVMDNRRQSKSTSKKHLVALHQALTDTKNRFPPGLGSAKASKAVSPGLGSAKASKAVSFSSPDKEDTTKSSTGSLPSHHNHTPYHSHKYRSPDLSPSPLWSKVPFAPTTKKMTSLSSSLVFDSLFTSPHPVLIEDDNLTSCLQFETKMTREALDEYSTLIRHIANDSLNCMLCMDLVVWLLNNHLGKEALAVLGYVFDILTSSTFMAYNNLNGTATLDANGTARGHGSLRSSKSGPSGSDGSLRGSISGRSKTQTQDMSGSSWSNKLTDVYIESYALLHLAISKMAGKYLCEYSHVESVRDIVSRCTHSPEVLAQLGSAYHKLRYLSEAELCYTGALLLDPVCPEALRGFAILLTEKKKYSIASRYLQRIPESSPIYPISRTELAWVLEISSKMSVLKATDDAIRFTYKSNLNVSSTTRRNESQKRAASLSLSSLAHFDHVRGNLPRAEALYRRSINYDGNNACAMVMLSCLTTSVAATPAAIEEMDSRFRRGLYFIRGKNRWMGLLAYGEAVTCMVGDYKRAEEILWEAVYESQKYTIWPVIALAHFFQYVKGKSLRSKNILTWAMRKRSLHPLHQKMFSNADNESILLFISTLRGDEKANAKRMLDEQVVLHVTMAYCLLDCVGCEDPTSPKDSFNTQAWYHVEAAYKLDSAHPCVHRCLGILLWQRPAKRKESLFHFAKSLKTSKISSKGENKSSKGSNGKVLETNGYDGSCNPYVLRLLSVVTALEGRLREALKIITAAVTCDPLNRLAWRALGIMSYLYSNQESGSQKNLLETCVLYFEKGLALSKERNDVQSLRLVGQLLMELGRFADARKVFQEALQWAPTDSFLLLHLGLCLSALGYQPPTNLSMTYTQKIETVMFYAEEFHVSEDPDELIEAAIYPDLASRLMKNCEWNGRHGEFATANRKYSTAVKKVQAAYLMTNAADKKDGDNSHAESVAEHTIPTEILYLSGMYFLNRKPDEVFTRANNQERAKDLFHRAVQRTDCTPHPLALYMLGWIAELNGDFKIAERYYCYAIQLEPIDPMSFLKLFKLSQETLEFIRGATSNLEQQEKKIKKKTKKGQSKSVKQAFDNDAKGKITVDIMRNRLLLHERIQQLIHLRRNTLASSLIGLNTPGRFVFIETFWLEKIFYTFSECDDWAWLLKSSLAFREGEKPINSTSK